MHEHVAELRPVGCGDVAEDERLEPSFPPRMLAHSVPQERRRRVGAEPLLSFACGGQPVVLVSEPDADRHGKKLGWVVRPGVPEDLVNAIRAASMAERAVAAAGEFTLDRATMSCADLVDELLNSAKHPGQPT